MFELTHKEGWKTLARMVETSDGLKYFELGSDWELKSDCWVWCEEIKQPITRICGTEQKN